MGDEGQEGHRVVRHPREDGRLRDQDREHLERQELRVPGAAREDDGADAAANTPSAADKTATPVVDAPAKDKHHHHSSSSASKDKGDSGSGDKAAGKEKPAGKSGGKDEGDDMKLLQPKF